MISTCWFAHSQEETPCRLGTSKEPIVVCGCRGPDAWVSQLSTCQKGKLIICKVFLTPHGPLMALFFYTASTYKCYRPAISFIDSRPNNIFPLSLLLSSSISLRRSYISPSPIATKQKNWKMKGEMYRFLFLPTSLASIHKKRRKQKRLSVHREAFFLIWIIGKLKRAPIKRGRSECYFFLLSGRMLLDYQLVIAIIAALPNDDYLLSNGTTYKE